MPKENFNIINLVNQGGCFDLQFRKDTRHERTGSPTYYRWKIQFVITAPKESVKLLDKAKKLIGCGKISQTPGQTRFSVQDIDDIINVLIPFFIKNKLRDVMKKDQSTKISGKFGARPSTYKNRCSGFDLWQKAVAIIYANKGIYISKWKKNDLHSLIEIHKSMAKYKHKPKSPKWIQMAQNLTKMI